MISSFSLNLCNLNQHKVNQLEKTAIRYEWLLLLKVKAKVVAVELLLV